MADSYPLPITTGVIHWRDDVLTPDGKSVFTGNNPAPRALVQANLFRFSAATGKAAVVNRVLISVGLNGTGYGLDDVLWTNFNGSKIIVLGARPGPERGSFQGNVATPNPAGQTAGIYNGTHYTPLPWPANVVDAGW